MKLKLLGILAIVLILSCTLKKTTSKIESNHNVDFTIAFGSCNKQYETNVLWKEILKNNPNLWIWGGDNIYADTKNMRKMKDDYTTQINQKDYKAFLKKTPILATWDDHDYGVNDGGVEFTYKKEAQQLFLDFLNVDAQSERRKREGIYHSKLINTPKGSIKVIVLDTRYFRTALTRAKMKNKKRYVPNSFGEGTILGKAQWNWLNSELTSSNADFNIVVSSIQFLSAEHGFEKWANFPHEVVQLKKVILNSKARNVVLLSGDRHISEFSQLKIDSLSYPLIDFTSSGLTHSYINYTGEPNRYRIKNVVSEISFGLLKFNFDKNTITMQMRGKDNILQQEFTQAYD
jgi:alkaline phosphatase D